MSLARTSHVVIELNPPPEQSQLGQYLHATAAMNGVLRQVPAGVGQVYVVSTGGLVAVNPDYLQAYLGLHASIIRVIDILWDCNEKEEVAGFDHHSLDGVVTLSATLPDCARFIFTYSRIGADMLVDGRLRRSDSISYELPDAWSARGENPGEPEFGFGRRMIVHIRPHGPARFIVERGGPDGGFAWFDTP